MRSSKQVAIQNIRLNIIKSSREYFDRQGLMLFDAPILSPVSCEGTKMLFETEYFGEKSYLTPSLQIYNESGAMAFGRIYSFGPIFRAE